MKVRDLMVTKVKTCELQDTLYTASETMWEHECGCVPVVDERGKVVGMLTDRDICLAAFADGRPLREIPVEVPLRNDPVSDEVWSCDPDDTVESALGLMREYKVHRLPVIDREGALVGIVSLDDIAQTAVRQRREGADEAISERDVCETLAAVCEPE